MKNYYEDNEYSYPWKNNDNFGFDNIDYIDYAENPGNGLCYAADYDISVK